MKYCIFYKGQILDPITQEWIVSAAKRGKITEKGKDLVLVPDTRYGAKDIAGYRSMKRVKNKDCIPLPRLCQK